MAVQSEASWKMNDGQDDLREQIIGMEKHALDCFYNGDSSEYRKLWDRENFTYVDGFAPHRRDSWKDVVDHVGAAVDGKMYAGNYQFLIPRVQISPLGDTAVLTYELHADTNQWNMHYNCIEIFEKKNDGWTVINSIWSLIQPLTNDFGALSEKLRDNKSDAFDK